MLLDAVQGKKKTSFAALECIPNFIESPHSLWL